MRIAEKKKSQIAALYEQCSGLPADVRSCLENGYFTIGVLSVNQWGESRNRALSPYLLWKISSRRDFNAYRQDTGLPGISEGY